MTVNFAALSLIGCVIVAIFIVLAILGLLTIYYNIKLSILKVSKKRPAVRFAAWCAVHDPARHETFDPDWMDYESFMRTKSHREEVCK